MARQLKPGVSIARVMMLVAVVAMNCALLREVSWEFLTAPTVWAAMGILDFLVLWKLILRRQLRGSHYTFLIVFVVAFLVLVYLAARERIHPAGPFIRWYQQVQDNSGNRVFPVWVVAQSNIWLAAGTALLLALIAGLFAGWLERRRGWDIAAFFRGSLVGFGIANLFAMLNLAALGEAPQGSPAFYANLVVLAICMMGGGIWGLSRFKSTPLDNDDTEAQEYLGAVPFLIQAFRLSSGIGKITSVAPPTPSLRCAERSGRQCQASSQLPT